MLLTADPLSTAATHYMKALQSFLRVYGVLFLGMTGRSVTIHIAFRHVESELLDPVDINDRSIPQVEPETIARKKAQRVRNGGRETVVTSHHCCWHRWKASLRRPIPRRAVKCHQIPLTNVGVRITPDRGR